MALLALVLMGSTLAQTEQPEESLWYGRYWNNTTLSGDTAFERNEVELDYFWGTGSPAPSVNVDHFSARWTSFLEAEAGVYRFVATGDDGMRVWVEDEWIIDDWEIQNADTQIAYKRLSEGSHDVVVEYFENEGVAEIEVTWERVDDDTIIDDDETLSIVPSRGIAGTTVTVTGAGFVPNQAIDLGVGEVGDGFTVTTSTVTDSAGNLRAAVQIPETAEVGESWQVSATTDQRLALARSNAFTVTATVAEQPCGDTYRVRTGDTLNIIADRCNTSVAALMMDNPSIVNPNVIFPGELLNIPERGEFGTIAMVSPSIADRGEQVQISADGFPANAIVNIGIGRVNSEYDVIERATVDIDGSVRAIVAVPFYADPDDTWVFVVTTEDGNVQAITDPIDIR